MFVFIISIFQSSALYQMQLQFRSSLNKAKKFKYSISEINVINLQFLLH